MFFKMYVFGILLFVYIWEFINFIYFFVGIFFIFIGFWFILFFNCKIKLLICKILYFLYLMKDKFIENYKGYKFVFLGF